MGLILLGAFPVFAKGRTFSVSVGAIAVETGLSALALLEFEHAGRNRLPAAKFQVRDKLHRPV